MKPELDDAVLKQMALQRLLAGGLRPVPSHVNEGDFRRWYADLRTKYRMPVPDDPDATPPDVYDYRAAFAAGEVPQWFAGNEREPAGYHLGGSGKGNNHPTRVVGGFDTKTGERVPGTYHATAEELIRGGWDEAFARRNGRR